MNDGLNEKMGDAMNGAQPSFLIVIRQGDDRATCPANQQGPPAEAHYSLDNHPKMVLDAEYQSILPYEKLIADELDRSRRELERR